MNYSKKRVVVTGLGAVTPLGNDLHSSWQSILSGGNGVSKITRFDLPEKFPVTLAGEVKDFDITKYISAKEAKKMDLAVQFGVAASLQAIADANLVIGEDNQERVGVWIGTGIGGFQTLIDQDRVFINKGTRRVSPFFIPMMIPDMVAGQVAIVTGAKGPNGCTVTACASGANSIGEAFEKIQLGKADVMIAGGAEAPITDLGLSGFNNMKALSTNQDPETASRPFDKNRDGFVMGEGAGVLILEELEHAISRGARIYAELAGYGTSGDAYHITSPDPDGAGSARAFTAALHEADISPQQIDYINAHGTGTPLNDKFETLAIKNVLGEYAKTVSISSTKSMTGHMIGAAGAVEAAFSVMSIRENMIPPTIHLQEPDPECDLDYTPNHAREKEIHIAASNSLGFGGHNVTLIFRQI